LAEHSLELWEASAEATGSFLSSDCSVRV
jgi:hypothetical protein